MAQVFDWAFVCLDLYLTYKSFQLVVWTYKGELPPRYVKYLAREKEEEEKRVVASTQEKIKEQMMKDLPFETPIYSLHKPYIPAMKLNESHFNWSPPENEKDFQAVTDAFDIEVYPRVYRSELSSENLEPNPMIPDPGHIPKGATKFRLLGEMVDIIKKIPGPHNTLTGIVVKGPKYTVAQFAGPMKQKSVTAY